MEDKSKYEKDSFWDIDKLVPKKKEKYAQSQVKRPRLADVQIKTENNVSNESKFSIGKSPVKVENATVVPQPPKSYAYQNLSSLIRHVEITDWKTSYHYYEFFCQTAASLRNARGERCARVPFFSYVPQYSQMSKTQLAWYLWWRSNLEDGIYLDTDVSYILLYFYEVINLGDMLDTKKAIEDMICVWSHYRNTYPQLNASSAEWICDYSLIHGIPIPFPHDKIDRDMIGNCSLREAYYAFDPHDSVLYAKFLLTYCNAYNYRKSKFYTEENAPLYDIHITAALAKLLDDRRAFFLDGHCHLHKVSRTAFTGALCSYRIRKKIDVEYISLSDTEELRDIITTVIKYCENKLRAYLGIRSRLGVKQMERDIAEALDEYFTNCGISTIGREDTAILPEYEKLYDVKDTEFSLDRAMEIERSSWNMTEKLVDAFTENVPDDTEIESVSPVLTEEENESSDSNIDRFLHEIGDYTVFFEYVLRGDLVAQEAFCKQLGILPEAVADVINEKAVDIFEDILIEETDGGYIVIEDYKSMFV